MLIRSCAWAATSCTSCIENTSGMTGPRSSPLLHLPHPLKQKTFRVSSEQPRYSCGLGSYGIGRAPPPVRRDARPSLHRYRQCFSDHREAFGPDRRLPAWQGSDYMEYRQLGRSGLKVSALTLGTMTFGGKGNFA